MTAPTFSVVRDKSGNRYLSFGNTVLPASDVPAAALHRYPWIQHAKRKCRCCKQPTYLTQLVDLNLCPPCHAETTVA